MYGEGACTYGMQDCRTVCTCGYSLIKPLTLRSVALVAGAAVPLCVSGFVVYGVSAENGSSYTRREKIL